MQESGMEVSDVKQKYETLLDLYEVLQEFDIHKFLKNLDGEFYLLDMHVIKVCETLKIDDPNTQLVKELQVKAKKTYEFLRDVQSKSELLHTQFECLEAKLEMIINIVSKVVHTHFVIEGPSSN